MTAVAAPEVLDSREILSQALDTLRATYWIKGEEFNQDHKVYFTSEQAAKIQKIRGLSPVHRRIKRLFKLGEPDWDGLEKAVVIPSQVREGNNFVVTGVCSIGAMALVNATVKGTELIEFDALSDSDFEHHRAGMALAQAIQDAYPDQAAPAVWCTYPGIIADWNDDEERERKQVLAAFKAAIEGPWVERKDWWRIGKAADPRVYLPPVLRSKAAAEKFAAQLEDSETDVGRRFQMSYNYSRDRKFEIQRVSASTFR